MAVGPAAAMTVPVQVPVERAAPEPAVRVSAAVSVLERVVPGPAEVAAVRSVPVRPVPELAVAAAVRLVSVLRPARLQCQQKRQHLPLLPVRYCSKQHPFSLHNSYRI